MLKIRRPLGRLIFNMGIAIPGKTVFLIETAPCNLNGCPCIQPWLTIKKTLKLRITGPLWAESTGNTSTVNFIYVFETFRVYANAFPRTSSYMDDIDTHTHNGNGAGKEEW